MNIGESIVQLNRSYWERRAEQELDLAQAATDERVCRAHYELLGFYLDLLHPPRPFVGAPPRPDG